MSDYLTRTALWWAIAAASLTASWILARWDERRQAAKKGLRR
ncbi:hypothetical protein OG279_26155 [Streptomyces sp. NBC_01201]|nr:hypothetical protein OG279_26155 [Streptomyces sp. NBC_01201]